MKAIIDNKLYDTTTSDVLFSDGSSAFFRTKNGAYFRTSPNGIEAMTEDEAKAYIGIHDADTYIKEFGAVAEA